MSVPGMDAVGDFISQGVEKLGGHLSEFLTDRQGANLGRETVLAQEHEFSRSIQGSKLYQRVQNYDMMRGQILDKLNKPVQLLDAGIADKPKALKQTIGDMHKDFVAANDPLQKHTKDLLNLDPEHGNKTLLQVNAQHRKQAMLLAQKNVMGEHSEHIIGDIMDLYDSPDPTMHSHANAMLDSIAVHTHDTMKMNGAAASKVKLDMKKALSAESKFREAMDMKPLAVDPEKFSTTGVYQESNKIEQFAGRRARMFLAPLIAVNHISTFFNNAWAPLTSIGKAMATYSDKDIQDLVQTSGIMGSEMHSIIDRDIRARTGMTASLLKSPRAADMIDQVIHTPGFDQMRSFQIKFTGVLGYHATQEWAQKAVLGDRRAIAELTEMNLPVKDIVARGGKLTDQELREAIWHFTNNRMFIDKQLDRSLMSRKSPWTRMATMFHGYVTSQQRFMRRELVKMWKAKDYVGIARFAGTVGVVFPAIAPMIKSAELLLRTGSPTQAGKSIENDYKTLADAEHPGAQLSEYFDLLSHFGAWGTMSSYIKAAHSDRLALTLLGPMPAAATRTGQDIINYVTKPSKSGQRNIRPLAKDILQQTVPIGGNIAASELFPKKGASE